NADAATRAQVARVLLSFSRLGVLLVGELAPNALAGQLAPLKEAMTRGPWPNRDLLLVPLGSGAALATQTGLLGGRGDVAVHVAPQASRPQQVWAFIGGAWNRLHGRAGGERALPTELSAAVQRPRPPVSEAATEPMPLEPAPAPPAPPRQAHVFPSVLPPSMAPTPPRLAPAPAAPAPVARAAAAPVPRALPAVPPVTAMPVPGGTRWQAYADRCALIKGTLSCCVFDLHASQPLAHAGGQPAADRMAQQGSVLLGQTGEVARALGLGPGRAEVTVSTASHHLLLRPVPGHPGIAVQLVLGTAVGNLTLARMQLERIEAPQ
ncbi:MAG: hypothetical protein KGL50_04635, partial [Burkholderiales bacterium]|nr:hypothetical protein [Burkholderiales bacterium]